MWYSVDIIKKVKPKIVIWENVANVLSKKHFHNFSNYVDSLSDMGYISTFAVLNAQNFGIPQNRERLYCVSILDGIFDFGKIKHTSPIQLYKILENSVDEKYYLTDEQLERIRNWRSQQRPLKTVLGRNSICPTLTARGAGEWHSGIKLYCKNFDTTTNIDNISMPRDIKIRTLTPKECFRLMGFSDDDYEKVKDMPNGQLYKMTGNSIVVNVLASIFREMANQGFF